jgi:hypothetical protein
MLFDLGYKDSTFNTNEMLNNKTKNLSRMMHLQTLDYCLAHIFTPVIPDAKQIQKVPLCPRFLNFNNFTRITM